MRADIRDESFRGGGMTGVRIGYRLRNDLYCVEWGVKLYSNQPTNPNRVMFGGGGGGGQMPTVAECDNVSRLYVYAGAVDAAVSFFLMPTGHLAVGRHGCSLIIDAAEKGRSLLFVSTSTRRHFAPLNPHFYQYRARVKTQNTAATEIRPQLE